MSAPEPPRPEGPDDPSGAVHGPLRVRLVLDHEIVREGLAAMLARHPETMTLVPPEESGQVSVVVHGAAVEAPADLVRAREAAEADHLVLLTMNGTPPISVDPRLVSAHLEERVSTAVLIDTIERVATGEPVSQPGVREAAATHDLSDREALIISLITAGLSNKQVAEVAFLSVNTVKSYIRGAYRKMGVTSRSQAVLWGLRHEMKPVDHLADEVALYFPDPA